MGTTGLEYLKFKKPGNQIKYEDPEKLWEAFESYVKWNDKRVWNKMEAIKSGDRAGQLIKIPLKVPLTIEGFCVHAGIIRQTFLNYGSGIEPWTHLLEVATQIREVIESHQLEGASVNAFNPNIIARKLGLADKKEVKQESTSTVVHLGSGQRPPEDDSE